MYMFKYVMKRIGLMLMTFAIIMATCFILIKLLPIVITLAPGQDRDILEAQLKARGYYDPILVQFINYLKRIFLHGDFGIGVNMPEFRNKEVWDVFVSSCLLPYSLTYILRCLQCLWAWRLVFMLHSVRISGKTIPSVRW